MKKKILCTLALIGAINTSAFAAESIAFNGKTVDNSSVIEENGITYISVRPIAEALGLNVEWIGETKTVIISNGGPLYITFSIGNNGYTIAKTAPMPLSASPIIVNSTTYVPTDVITDLLSYEIKEENNVLNIITDEEKTQATGKGIVIEVSDEEILFNDETRGEIRLNKSDAVIVMDEEGNELDINTISVDTRLIVEYGNAMTMSIPPLNNPVTIVICK